MKFFTLVHIGKGEQTLHNNNFVKSFEEQINLYFSCAKRLYHSLKPAGIELIVLTNDKAFLEDLFKNDDYPFRIIQIEFFFEVPSGIKFYSSHFKIDVYRYLSTLDEPYVGLIDCDVICVNDMPESFKTIIENKVPLYYDITDQVMPAYGQNRVINDKQAVGKSRSVGLWAGGEFFSGPPAFFGKMYSEINKIKAEYFKIYKTLHHIGDEIINSVAIENMIFHERLGIMDAGSLSIIARFWSPETLHVQKSIDAYMQHFLLHIPSDKKFIAGLDYDELKGERFFKKYKQHLVKMRMLEKAFKGIKPYAKKIRQNWLFEWLFIPQQKQVAKLSN